MSGRKGAERLTPYPADAPPNRQSVERLLPGDAALVDSRAPLQTGPESDAQDRTSSEASVVRFAERVGIAQHGLEPGSALAEEFRRQTSHVVDGIPSRRQVGER